jgi:hypothetical protein
MSWIYGEAITSLPCLANAALTADACSGERSTSLRAAWTISTISGHPRSATPYRALAETSSDGLDAKSHSDHILSVKLSEASEVLACCVVAVLGRDLDLDHRCRKVSVETAPFTKRRREAVLFDLPLSFNETESYGGTCGGPPDRGLQRTSPAALSPQCGKAEGDVHQNEEQLDGIGLEERRGL